MMELILFPKIICLKVIILVGLEFEHAYYEVTIQHVNHYAMGTPTCI